MTTPQTRAQFEELLRSAGFSNRQAKRIAAEGFHAETVEETLSAKETAAAERLLTLFTQPFDLAGDVRNEHAGNLEQETQHPASLDVRNEREDMWGPADAPETGTPGNENLIDGRSAARE